MVQVLLCGCRAGGGEAEMKRREVFVFADALGWDLVGESGYLKELLPYRKAVSMQFGYSCTAIPTILSGKTPAEHGHLAFFRYAPGESPFKGWGALGKLLRPAGFWNRGRVRALVSRAVKRVKGWTGYFQLYRMPWEKLELMDYAEKRNLFVRGGMGAVENLADACERAGVKWHISDWRKGDEAAFADARAALAGGAEFMFVYTAGLDAIRHDEARDAEAPRTKAKLEWYRERIGELIGDLKAGGGEWRLSVFSDHGMTPLKGTIDVLGALEGTGLKFGEDYAACCDSTMLRVHYLREGAREKVEAAMGAFAGSGRWVDEEEERRWGIWREDRRFGEAIFLCDAGVQIAPSDMGEGALEGMHGYEPGEEHSLAAAMSTEEIPEGVKAVGDYFGWMTCAMGRREKGEGGNGIQH